MRRSCEGIGPVAVGTARAANEAVVDDGSDTIATTTTQKVQGTGKAGLWIDIEADMRRQVTKAQRAGTHSQGSHDGQSRSLQRFVTIAVNGTSQAICQSVSGQFGGKTPSLVKARD